MSDDDDDKDEVHQLEGAPSWVKWSEKKGVHVSFPDYVHEPAMLFEVKIQDEHKFRRGNYEHRVSIAYRGRSRDLYWDCSRVRIWPPDPRCEDYQYRGRVFCSYPANDDAICAFDNRRDWMLHDEVTGFCPREDFEGLKKGRKYIPSYVGRFDVKSPPETSLKHNTHHYYKDYETNEEFLASIQKVMACSDLIQVFLHRPASSMPEIGNLEVHKGKAHY